MNPVTEEVICHVQEGDKADVDKAVEAATKVKLKKNFFFYLAKFEYYLRETQNFYHFEYQSHNRLFVLGLHGVQWMHQSVAGC